MKKHIKRGLCGAICGVVLTSFAVYLGISYVTEEVALLPEGREVKVCNISYRGSVITDENVCQEVKQLLGEFTREKVRNTKPMRQYDFDVLIMVDQEPWHIAANQDFVIMYQDSKRYNVRKPEKFYKQIFTIVLGGIVNEE